MWEHFRARHLLLGSELLGDFFGGEFLVGHDVQVNDFSYFGFGHFVCWGFAFPIVLGNVAGVVVKVGWHDWDTLHEQAVFPFCFGGVWVVAVEESFRIG